MENPPTGIFECKNLQSAIQAPEIVSALLTSEMDKGFLSGPFDECPFLQYRVSPIGVAYGKYSGKPRLIVDFSSPHDDSRNPSINELIDKKAHSLSYVTIDDAIKLIHLLGRGCMLMKTDICDAYKICPVNPNQWKLQCIKWEGLYYVYTKLCFGSRSSPKIFDTLAEILCWIARRKYHIKYIIHLLDDFLCVDPLSRDSAQTMSDLKRMFSDLGIPIAAHKTVGPVCELEFLGIILNSELMTARLPDNKKSRIILAIAGFTERRSVTKVELLRLLGHFAFASKVVPAGRPFLSYLINLSTTVKELHHHVSFTPQCREDLVMWVDFLNDWNGVSILLEPGFTPAADLELSTDASGTIGFAGYFRGHWFQSRWPVGMRVYDSSTNSMARLELFPIVVASLLWGHIWRGKRIMFYCDNQAVVFIIRKGRSRSAPVNHLMRILTLSAARAGFVISATYIASKDNDISDALSRFQMERFAGLAPDADPSPTPIPDEIMRILNEEPTTCSVKP